MDTLDGSTIRIDPAAPTPPFEQVRAHIAGLIAAGDLPSGTKLPTVRRLAADVGLAVNTAARVYKELEGDGLVATYGRRGTFVSSELADSSADSGVAVQARSAAEQYAALARRLGLTRAEALQLVEQTWG